jgi:hypothetical protein|tara:strand:- start:19 stop:261 length:243 start_codon:yes stop_codon:yes gene_type:complete
VTIGLVLLSVLCLLTLSIFKSDLNLWKDSVKLNPNHSISVMNVELTYWGRQELNQALVHLYHANTLIPKNVVAKEYQGLI